MLADFLFHVFTCSCSEVNLGCSKSFWPADCVTCTYMFINQRLDIAQTKEKICKT